MKPTPDGYPQETIVHEDGKQVITNDQRWILQLDSDFGRYVAWLNYIITATPNRTHQHHVSLPPVAEAYISRSPVPGIARRVCAAYAHRVGLQLRFNTTFSTDTRVNQRLVDLAPQRLQRALGTPPGTSTRGCDLIAIARLLHVLGLDQYADGFSPLACVLTTTVHPYPADLAIYLARLLLLATHYRASPHVNACVASVFSSGRNPRDKKTYIAYVGGEFDTDDPFTLAMRMGLQRAANRCDQLILDIHAWLSHDTPAELVDSFILRAHEFLIDVAQLVDNPSLSAALRQRASVLIAVTTMDRM